MLPKTTTSTEEDKFHIGGDIIYVDDRTRVLNHFDTFGIFDQWGDIHPHARKLHGIYHEGTRFLNRLELRINGQKPLLLSSAIKENNQVLSVDLTNPAFPDCHMSENTVHISRSQFIRNGVFYEEILLANYGPTSCSLDLSLQFGSDFKDLFEIRGIERKSQQPKCELLPGNEKIIFEYTGLDNITRRTEMKFEDNGYQIKRNLCLYTFELDPQEVQQIHYSIFFNAGDSELESIKYTEVKKAIREEQQTAHRIFADIVTSNEQFNHWVTRSKADLLSLLSQTRYGMYPYAGVPWYNTAFGRDGIITAMETLWLAPEISKNVLLFLAQMQAGELRPEKDAEPGKILHETRSGEMANTGEVPFGKYYGTIDATPLFVMLAGMYYERTHDKETIMEIWPNIKMALFWINEYGDIDNDGFVEYIHKSENGLTNQGWKDSHDSVMYENGDLCEPPIALCEVQGYVYSAKKYGSILAAIFNENEVSERLSREANQLKKLFNEKFWDSELGCYVLALDGNKKPCRVISSNAGQCLFTGIVDEDKAPMLADTLMHENMFSGWGIRTLAKGENRFNPMSYHNGSIWPHDNALIAYGLSLYGFQEESLRIMNALFDASLFIDLQRLPELYCGFERKANEGPTAYPVACSPQAWSVTVLFMLLQSCLKISINAHTKTIVFNKPELPAYLERIHVSKLKIGESELSFDAYRHQFDIGFNVRQKPPGWEVIIKK
jgi:glycogen debranching enzyme